jgi:transposase InsO family protein
MIDTVTNYLEVIRVPDKSSLQVARSFENNWLARYPRPLKVIFDRGGEFVGLPFQEMLENAGIRGHAVAVKNPRANAIVERMHQTIANCLRSLIRSTPPRDMATAENFVDDAIATATYSLRASVHRSLKASPGSIAFHRDMLLDVPLLINMETLRQQRQALVDQTLLDANKKRRFHDYRVGDEILTLTYQPNKMEPRARGPYQIVQVHTNGTVTYQRDEHVQHRISIRFIKPFRQ